MSYPIRRVVTGRNAAGKSTIVADQPIADGPAPHDRYVWTSAGVIAGGTGDAAIAPHRLEPGVGGSIFRVVEFPPQSALAGLSAEEKEAFFAHLFAGMDASHCRVDTARSPGMHKTRTLDYVVVLRGEVTLLLEQGETTLKPGDLVVQQATNHDWIVRGEEPALLAVVMLGLPTH